MHTILVLEDDIELNNTICCSLEKNGYRVMGARTCEEAKNYANSYTFHMAILDINLPDGNGFQFCKWLKARSNTWSRRLCDKALFYENFAEKSVCNLIQKVTRSEYL